MKTLNTFKEWMANQYDTDELKDIVEYGGSQGCNGITMYHETTALYNKYHKDIWELVNEEAIRQFEGSMGDMLQLLAYNDNICNDETFKNALVWFAAETIARELTDDLEEEGEE